MLFKIISKYFFSSLNILFTKGAALIAGFFVAKFSGAEGFANFSYIYLTIITLSSILSFSMFSTGSKLISKYHNDFSILSSIISLNILIAFIGGLLGAFLFYILIKVNVIIFTYDPYLISLIMLSITLSTTSFSLKGILVGFEELKTVSRVSLILGVIYLVLMYFAIQFLGDVGAIISFCLFLIIESLLYFFIIFKMKFKDELKLQFILNYQLIKEYKEFSFPAFLSSALLLGVSWYAIHFIKLLDNGVELAIFFMANQWRTFLTLIPAIAENVSLPMISKHLLSSNKMVRSAIKFNVIIVMVASIIVTAVLIMLSNFILGFYGESFSGGGYVFVLMMLSGFLFSVNSLIGQIIASVGNMWHGLGLNMAWACFYITGVLIYVNSSKTLAEVFIVSYMFHTVIQIAYAIFIKYCNRGFLSE